MKRRSILLRTANWTLPTSIALSDCYDFMEPLKERLYLSVPHMGEASLRYVEEAFATNWLSTVGPNLVELEKSASAMGRGLLAIRRVGFCGGGLGIERSGRRCCGLRPGVLGRWLR